MLETNEQTMQEQLAPPALADPLEALKGAVVVADVVDGQVIAARFETLPELMKRTEREAIVAALQRHDGRGRIGKTALELGISRKNLWEKIRRHGINKKIERAQESFL